MFLFGFTFVQIQLCLPTNQIWYFVLRSWFWAKTNAHVHMVIYLIDVFHFRQIGESAIVDRISDLLKPGCIVIFTLTDFILIPIVFNVISNRIHNIEWFDQLKPIVGQLANMEILFLLLPKDVNLSIIWNSFRWSILINQICKVDSISHDSFHIVNVILILA